MAPSELKRQVERDYRRCGKAAFPRWAQAHAAEAFRRSAYLKSESSRPDGDRQYRQRQASRSVDVLLQLHDMLRAYLSATPLAK